MPKTSKEKVNPVTMGLSEQLEVIDKFRDIVNDGQVEDFFIIGIDGSNQMIMASFCHDTVRGVGILELGKMALVNQQDGE